MRWYNLIFILVTLSTCFALYQMKYDNRDLHKKVAEIEKEIVKEKDAIKILRAEWSLLAQPSRIEKLSEKYLDLTLMEPAQIWREAELEHLPRADGIISAQSKKLNQFIDDMLITSSTSKRAGQ